jgi:hypothetical protein
MFTSSIIGAVSAVTFILPGLAAATPPDGVSHGKPARESIVMQRFEAMEQRLLALESGMPQQVSIDCNADVNAFLGTTIRSNTIYTLSGMCNGPIWIDNRHDIVIQGDNSGSGDDGVLLPPGLAEHPVGAIALWKSTAIRLDNLALSADNYVNQTYSFGENVAALGVAEQSWAEVADVAFSGGDFSVDVNNGAQLSLRQGVSIVGYNRAGLSAYNHGLIRTHDDISVSGIVGRSTETYPYAIVAINNSIVEITAGGNFSGASGQPVDEYPTAVWSGDNSSIRFSNSANPTTVNGSIESAYSSMVRISGNLTLNGALASYHRGYIRATGLTQSGGPIYAGDAATIRFESSRLTPPNATFPWATLDIYRQGNLRMNDTEVNLNGNTIYVSGFGFLNLRGETDLNHANISCHDRHQISIRPSVDNVGFVNCFQP